MANVRMTKKIKETIRRFNNEINLEKWELVTDLTKDTEVRDTICDWMDSGKKVCKDYVIFCHSNYDDWESAIIFYCGKKPEDLEYCYFQGSVKISKKMFEFLKNYSIDNLETKKKKDEWWAGLQDKANKKEQSKKREKVAKLDFDGEITSQEIREQNKDFYVKFMDSKITFHKRIDTTHFSSVPEFTIKIKKIETAHGSHIYNKAEYENAMKNRVKKIEVSEDLIKYALSFVVTINANKKNEIELRYSYDGTNNRWWTAWKAIIPATATKTGIKNAIKTFGEKRANRIH